MLKNKTENKIEIKMLKPITNAINFNENNTMYAIFT